MSALMIGAGLIAVATITPGPNNLLVMRIAARSGFMSALPAMAGVVTGGLAMWALVMAGASAAFQALPHLYNVITIGGGAYLCWMGVRLIVETFAASGRSQPAETSVRPNIAVALFGFQFLNPKGWVLVLTVTAAVGNGADPLQTSLMLAVLFTVIPVLCLTLWCAMGILMMRYLDTLTARNWIDRLMGALLFASALLLVLVPVDMSHR
ncbi:LysE family translocator [Stenotrophomonas sp. SY1]|jgi:threonine/homoserine/homoserine lactone efflux protein|uniref:LysE family translocator n=1 Tax=Stenotrophomonas sp. SY1 TaxID=477235 RepID=UPI001E554C72|nr:LysE family translocator [Stenotrophomonas sp. SY1]MCD9087091.1 LysE family translocator [Stenotrophomonas sp. SY1]